mmetsp:Transcript_882/g.2138  ORF Transcript_882/g.2138 Transcript_882/m.2138 type:complete len:99 (+) Transcript_882:535-831(+)
MCGEILLLGVPVLLAVRDSIEAKFIVLSSVVFLNDAGILCFVFVPKMKFVKEGLPEGVAVVHSVFPNRRSSLGQIQDRVANGNVRDLGQPGRIQDQTP